MSSIRVGVALLGFGTVGSSAYNLLREESKIQAKHGFGFDVRKVFVRDLHSRRVVSLPKNIVTSNIQEIIRDESIDVVIEVMGGMSPAREYILAALKAGKHVITANKALMGCKGEEIIARSRQYGRYLGFAASVTGCHQLCPSIVSSVMIKSLAGIFNGTSNYILTRMEEGLGFDEALREAQAKGYAEADPTEDIDGGDTCNKLIIISKLAFGVFLEKDQIPVEGIRQITLRDMEFARKLGYTIRLLGISKITDDGKIHARVHPCFVPERHLLASVRGICNGIQIHDGLRGVQGMTAAGAGGRPTAMAIFSDLMSITQDKQTIWPPAFPSRKGQKYARPDSWVGRYYVRLEVENHPGVLSGVSKIFGRYKINITSVIQHEPAESSHVPLIIMCGPTQERNIKRALHEIHSLKSVRPKSLFIRVEDALQEEQGSLLAIA